CTRTKQRAPAIYFMEHLRCSTISMRAAAMAAAGETHHLLQPAGPATHGGYAVQQQRRMNRSSAIALVVAIASELPSDAVVATATEPTTDRRSLPRSKPFIMTATTSTFQICRGCKPTLITEATRGKSSSPVINKFNSIPLRSQRSTRRFLLEPIRPSIFQKHMSSFPRPCPSSARPGLDDPGRSSCHTADPRSTTQPAQPTCCRTSITPPPVVATPTSTSQHAATATASPAPTADVAAHALATASARCPHPPPSSMPSAPSINGHDCLARVGSKEPPAYH
ncbi:hypothetical protein ACLOJK_007019, partial [Asimina triloba]